MKSNALARGIEGMPNYWREYGSRLLLVVLVAAIVFLLVRYWNDKKARDAELISTSMQSARSELRELDGLPLQLARGVPPSLIAEDRDKLAQQIEQSLSTVLNSSKDTRLLANAYLMRGDLNWALSNFPALPGAQTQPSLDVPNRDGLLQQAQSSYEKVLDPALSPTVDDTFYARVGLAAIAENQAQWDKAKQQYQAIADAGNMMPSYKEYAKERLEQLPEIQSSVLLVPPPPVTSEQPAPLTQGSPHAPRGPIGPMPPPSLGLPSTVPSTALPTTYPLTKSGEGSLILTPGSTSRSGTTQP